ncbi:MAG: ligase-associated DNA damage response exonuclease [Rubrimonas sp.]|uniref:ligase-associated DNA damage response exonuclease n=1 Tax=Rubrimonas sp. TaxID=2036015 RepID=UPI002FDDC938
MTPALLESRPEGLYSPAAGVFIDPVRPVARAVVTHGHADHCRPGSRALLCTPETAEIARARFGPDAFGAVQPLRCGEALRVGDATLRLVPAGHVLGSAQVAIEAGGRRAVVSGDYKRRADPTCAPFELVPCDLFVTEATFGLPVFRHPPVEGEIAKLLRARARAPERAVAVGVYALGKAQRLIAELRRAGFDEPIHLHGALVKLCRLYERLGVPLGQLADAKATAKEALRGAIALAPPSALADRWARRLPDPIVAAASGWMRVRQRAKQRGVELPLIVSDHADWDELTATIVETGASEVWVTHGAEEALIHWCATRGIAARALSLAGREEGGE